AKELTDYLCARAPKLQKRPLVFYAHSMGGLVLKNWLIYQYHDKKAVCSETGTSIADTLGKIERLIFVGTPHSGAPMAVEALAEKYNLAGRSADAGWKNWFIKGAGRFFSRSLNKFGGTFPSLYELLPAPDDCFSIEETQIQVLRKGEQPDQSTNVITRVKD